MLRATAHSTHLAKPERGQVQWLLEELELGLRGYRPTVEFLQVEGLLIRRRFDRGGDRELLSTVELAAGGGRSGAQL